MLTPDLISRAGVDEVNAKSQLLTTLDHAAVQNGLHTEFVSNGKRVNFFSLVPKNGAPCFYGEIWKLRKAVHQRLGHTVREVFDICVAARIDERHNRDRTDLRFAASVVPISSDAKCGQN